MQNDVLLGIDGGGTYIRTAIVDLEGNLLSYVKWTGGAFIHKDANAKENVRRAVLLALEKADRTLSDIVAATAGVAGYDSECDLEWVHQLTDMDGLHCLTRHVNDAVIAHAGALLSKPGIIAISGTGSSIYGITETGRHIRNYDFGHYASSAARFLSYNSVYKIIAGAADSTDAEFVNRVLEYFHIQDVAALARQGAEGFIQDGQERNKFFGDMAPMVTDAALEGSHLAAAVCRHAAGELATGIRLVGANFESPSVSVALIGSVANSAIMKEQILDALKQTSNKEYHIVDPQLPAVLGAILLSMQLYHIRIQDHILMNLYKSAGQIWQPLEGGTQ